MGAGLIIESIHTPLNFILIRALRIFISVNRYDIIIEISTKRFCIFHEILN